MFTKNYIEQKSRREAQEIGYIRWGGGGVGREYPTKVWAVWDKIVIHLTKFSKLWDKIVFLITILSALWDKIVIPFTKFLALWDKIVFHRTKFWALGNKIVIRLPPLSRNRNKSFKTLGTLENVKFQNGECLQSWS